MKLNILFLILFLIITIKTKSILDSFTIDDFRENLIKEGLLGIIESIKEKYGQDVAIISCEELNQSRKGNCIKLVTEYIGPSSSYSKGPITRGSVEENLRCIKKLYYFQIKHSQIIKQSNLMLELKRVLRIKFTKEKSNMIYNKIISRARNLPPCED